MSNTAELTIENESIQSKESKGRAGKYLTFRLDNEEYGETGRQPTHTGSSADLAAIAQGCGIAKAYTIRHAEQLATLHTEIHGYDGPLVAVLKVSAEAVPRVLPPRDGPYLTQRFRAALLGEEAALNA